VKIYETVDPNTHRVTIRSEIADPNDELHPGRLANFVISVHNPVKSTSLSANGVVRESDGRMTSWVTNDRHHFVQRIIKIGLPRDNQVQVLDGLQRQELAVADGAVFLDKMLEAPPSDKFQCGSHMRIEEIIPQSVPGRSPPPRLAVPPLPKGEGEKSKSQPAHRGEGARRRRAGEGALSTPLDFDGALNTESVVSYFECSAAL
jgi:hypothetical protein